MSPLAGRETEGRKGAPTMMGERFNRTLADIATCDTWRTGRDGRAPEHVSQVGRPVQPVVVTDARGCAALCSLSPRGRVAAQQRTSVLSDRWTTERGSRRTAREKEREGTPKPSKRRLGCAISLRVLNCPVVPRHGHGRLRGALPGIPGGGRGGGVDHLSTLTTRGAARATATPPELISTMRMLKPLGHVVSSSVVLFERRSDGDFFPA